MRLQIPTQRSKLATLLSLHVGDCLLREVRQVLSLKKPLAFLPNKTLVKRYLTLLTTKCLFFCFTNEQVRLTETYFREKCSTDDCQKAIANRKQTKKTSQTYLNINIKAECLRDFEATYQEGSDNYKSYFFGQQYKIIYSTFSSQCSNRLYSLAQ